MNVFDLPGPEFLTLYVMLLGGAIGLLFLLRFLFRGPSDPGDARLAQLGALEAAYLGRGRRGAIDAAIAALAHREVLKVKLDGSRPRVKAIAAMPVDLTELEATVYEAAAASKAGELIGPLRRSAAEASERLAEPLRKNELVLDDGQQTFVRFVPTLPLLMCLAIGVQKLLVGIGRDKPVEFLILLCVLTLGMLIYGLAGVPHRTRRGDKLLEALRRRNAALEIGSPKHMAPSDVAMAFGLFGATILAGDQDLYRAMHSRNNSSSSCGSSSCGGGCGGGSGCGGGGGCGGGCGGCSGG